MSVLRNVLIKSEVVDGFVKHDAEKHLGAVDVFPAFCPECRSP